MKAALLKAPGNLSLEEVATPPCPEGGLLVRVRACSICSSDARMFYKGHPALIYPRILGHETSGEVFESRTPRFKPGDRVQIFPGICCGRCPACRRGDDNHCRDIAIMGFSRDGAFAEYIAVPPQSVAGGGVNLMPDGLSHEEAALAEPLASCLNGQELARVSQGDSLLIIGAGPIGLLHARLAVAKGASKVMAAETMPSRLAASRSDGIDRVINATTEDIAAIVREETDGRGVDVILLASSEAAVSSLLRLLAPQGRLCLFSGLPKEGAMVFFNANLIHYRELTIVGAYGSTARQNTEALNLIASDRVPVSDLITKKMPLEEITEGLEYVAGRHGLKAVIIFA